MPRKPLAAGKGTAFLLLAGVPSFAFFGRAAAGFFAEEFGVADAVFAAGLPETTTHALPSSTTIASAVALPGAFSWRAVAADATSILDGLFSISPPTKFDKPPLKIFFLLFVLVAPPWQLQ